MTGDGRHIVWRRSAVKTSLLAARKTQRGYVLVTVVIAAFLVATVAFLLSQSSTTASRIAMSDLERDAARYVAEAGLEHGLWLAKQADCSSYTSLVGEPFGTHSYSVTPTPADGSPIVLQSSALLSSGTSLTLTTAPVRVYSTSSSATSELQPGAAGTDTYIRDGANDSNNFGASGILKLNNQSAEEATLLAFDLSIIPAGAAVDSATLELWLQGGQGLGNGVIDVHRVTQAWVEGTRDGSAPIPGTGATYNSYNGMTNWANFGGDYASPPVDSITIPSLTSDWYQWDLTAAVRDWVAGAYPNDGVLLRASAGNVDKIYFTSGDGNAGFHPKLTVVYSCECGQACAAFAPPQNLLFVVGNTSGPGLTAEEVAHQTLIESWGYTVETIDDDATQAEFDAAVATSDVVFTTNDITASRLGTKVVDATIGVVTSEVNLSDEFGISSTVGWESGTVLEINDNSHYITSPFSVGLLTILTSNESLAYASGTLSPDLGKLASSSSGFGIVTLDAGAAMVGGGNAAGRRVQLPWGGSGFDPNNLNADGLTLLKRAIDWGAGAGGTALEIQVTDGNDDAEQLTSDGTMYLNSTDLELADNLAATAQPTDIVGIRFANVTIPHGESIQSAYIQFQVDELDSGAASLTIQGEATNDAAPFTSSAFDISSRSRTTASALWTPPEWTTIGERGVDQRTVDIAPVIQEIVDQFAWSSGNALVIIISGSGVRTAEAYEGDPAGAPTLHVEIGGGATPGAGPIAHWKLDETSGTIAFDSEGGHDGTLINGPAWVAGQIDGALDFDGSNDLVSVPHQATFTQAPMTVSAWFKLDTLPSTRSENGTIIDKRHTADPWASWTLYVYEALGDKIRFQIRDSSGTGYWLDSAASAVTNTWYHVVGTIDESYNARLYVNGALEPDDDNIGSLFSSNDEIRIGAGWSGGNRLDGVVDDVRYYDRALGAAEVSGLYAAGTGGGGGGGGGDCYGNYRDEFNNESYGNNDGTLTWSTNWIEINENDGWDSGDERVDDNDSDFHLRVRDNDGGGEGVYREADLSAYAGARFSFEYRRDGFDNGNDYVTIDVSPDGGSSWIELDRISGGGTDSSYVARGYDISAYIAADTRVRFLTSPNLGSGDEFYVDNIDISAKGCAD